ncbi:hypothetical protein ACVW0I_000961 [Bradyrhizobium sp. LM6.11]
MADDLGGGNAGRGLRILDVARERELTMSPLRCAPSGDESAARLSPLK